MEISNNCSKYPALNDTEFLDSPNARTIRILSEYLQPERIFKTHDIKDTIVFYGSARTPPLKEVKRKYKGQDITKFSEKEKAQYDIDFKMSNYYQDASKLAYKLTRWSKSLPEESKRFIVTSGGGGGMMEAANRGASLAKGLSCGLNIELPFEQVPNEFITKSLSIDFHYFFMRKFWFLYLAKALVIFPGGFGTCDELFEALTLIQTGKTKKPIPIVIYGTEFWKDIVNFDNLVKWNVISEKDLDLLHFSDSVDDAYNYIVSFIQENYLDQSDSKVL